MFNHFRLSDINLTPHIYFLQVFRLENLLASFISKKAHVLNEFSTFKQKVLGFLGFSPKTSNKACIYNNFNGHVCNERIIAYLKICSSSIARIRGFFSCSNDDMKSGHEGVWLIKEA